MFALKRKNKKKIKLFKREKKLFISVIQLNLTNNRFSAHNYRKINKQLPFFNEQYDDEDDDDDDGG